jgi:hypothetical protein
MKAKRNAYRIFLGKPEGNIRLGRPRYRWEDNIKVDLRTRGWNNMDWTELAQDRNKQRAEASEIL